MFDAVAIGSGQSLEVRRVKNVYYIHSFADPVLREAVPNHAKVAV